MTIHLRAWREHRGLTQQELADKAGVTQPTVSRIEGGAPASLYTLGKLADALNITPTELWNMPPALVAA
jgi:transcriptional regulator with XRE-family HTH domain